MTWPGRSGREGGQEIGCQRGLRGPKAIRSPLVTAMQTGGGAFKTIAEDHGRPESGAKFADKYNPPKPGYHEITLEEFDGLVKGWTGPRMTKPSPRPVTAEVRSIGSGWPDQPGAEAHHTPPGSSQPGLEAAPG